MTNAHLAHQRLHNQLITRQIFTKPSEVVEWLGAVQAQDYAAAKWALGLRLPGTTSGELEQAFAAGTILRTHVMRPTWHFVTPADIRWLLALTAPRVNAASAYQYRKLELDDALFARSNAVLEKALQGGKHLTRTELASVLQQAGIVTDDLRCTYIIMRAELDGIICSGARQGKQFTYALLAERAPHARTFERDEALAEFARRYFTGHGPATLQDFVWWSGLTVTDAKAGLAMVSSQLAQEVIDGQSYWFSPSVIPLFLEQGSGSIVNTASEAGLRGGAAGTTYTVSKHGVVGLTRSIAFHYGERGIRCNAVCPEGVATAIGIRKWCSQSSRSGQSDALSPGQRSLADRGS